MLIDLHAHSYLSAGCELNPKAVLERAGSFGLDGVAFTETNTQDGCDELFELGAQSKVKVFVGLELLTDKGQYLCFFPDPERAPEPVQMWGSNRDKPWNALECLTKLQTLGAAVVAARPYDREHPNPATEFVLTAPGLCAIEGYNARVRQTANELALEAAETRKLPCIGGSDARGTLDELGRGATFFKRNVRDQRDLVEALREGNFWPVQMVELPRLTRPGEAREAEKKRKRGGKRRPGMRWGGQKA